MIELTVNGRKHSVDVEPEMPLLWVLRDVLDVKGPKFGCGIAQCGACTVHLNGEPVRSCSVPVLAAVALLKKNRNPSDRDIDAAMTNMCRCGTYARIRTAIHAAAQSMKPAKA